MITHPAARPGAAPTAEPARSRAVPSDDGTGKLAARVARRIERDIMLAEWPVGQVLGSETELRERYRVSRAVLREAIRLVEHHQVASMRRGPAGGLVVQAPDAGAATHALVVYLEYVGTTVHHLLTARLLIEPLAAALVAERITEAGITRLRAVLAEEEATSPDPHLRRRNELHLVLADLTGNPALRLFIHVLIRLSTRYASEPVKRMPDPSRDRLLAEADRAHRLIVAAVVAGDTARAEFRAAQHLGAFRDWLIATGADRLARSTTTQVATAIPGVPDQKLAEVVAHRIRDEIAGGDWAVGSVLGSESALLAKWDVSRAVLREAVRLLEYHSVARMRRGPGGGLVVAAPDPTASIETMALCLDYQRTGVEDLRAIRQAIELGCVDQVAARAPDAEVARRLHAALRSAARTGREQRGELPHLLHTEIAELSGNPVLALFLHILTTLSARHVDAPSDTPDVDESIVHAHQCIVDALVAGDAELARHRVRRHLSAHAEWWH